MTMGVEMGREPLYKLFEEDSFKQYLIWDLNKQKKPGKELYRNREQQVKRPWDEIGWTKGKVASEETGAGRSQTT